MKKLSFVMLLVHACAFAYSQEAKENQALKPVITFSETTYDYGNINESNGKVSHTFEVTNTGNAALLISNVQASCGCAVSEWSKAPIDPGNKGFIKVTYNPENRPGAFNKTITVTSNAAESPVVIKIKGTVIQKEINENTTKP